MTVLQIERSSRLAVAKRPFRPDFPCLPNGECTKHFAEQFFDADYLNVVDRTGGVAVGARNEQPLSHFGVYPEQRMDGFVEVGFEFIWN